MIKEYGGLFFYIYSDSQNIVYNRIVDTATGRSCYPDILVRHGFKEAAVADGRLYADAVSMQQKYGTSNCFFISAVSDDAIDEFAGLVQNAYCSCRTDFPKPDGAELERLCGDLALSQTMKSAFGQLMRYYALTADADELIKRIRGRYSLPVSAKNEGKRIYEAVRNEILR